MLLSLSDFDMCAFCPITWVVIIDAEPWSLYSSLSFVGHSEKKENGEKMNENILLNGVILLIQYDVLIQHFRSLYFYKKTPF